MGGSPSLHIGYIQEDPGDNDFNNDDDAVYFEGDFNLLNPSDKFGWNNELPEPPAASALKSKLDEGDPKNVNEAIENLQAAFGDLKGMVFDTHVDSQADALEVLAHVGLSLADIVAGIDRINHRGKQWMCKIGNVEVLCNDSGI